MENKNTSNNKKNHDKRTAIIDKATDNGRCWWLKQYIIGSMTFGRTRKRGESS